MISPRVVWKHLFAMRTCFKLGRPAFVKFAQSPTIELAVLHHLHAVIVDDNLLQTAEI